jgi:hypothetical protein
LRRLDLAAGIGASGEKGHKVFSPTLTGLGERSHLLSKAISLDTHIKDIVTTRAMLSRAVCRMILAKARLAGLHLSRPRT